MSASAAGWIAVGAVAGAAVAFVLAAYALIALRKVRGAQRVVLAGERADLVDFAVSLQARVDDLGRAVDEIAAGIARVDRRVDTRLGNTSIVRYDAYQGTGGQQSASVAMLDSERSGVVLSAIQGRDYARVYLKELDHGRAPVALSPEELDAVERAMSVAGEAAPRG